MYFTKDEKVFSLTGTADVVQRTDIKSLWEEFFSYLLISGFYAESSGGADDVHCEYQNISNSQFEVPGGVYSWKILQIISKGLHMRFMALNAHPHLNETEREVLRQLDGIYSDKNCSYFQLSASRMIGIALTRGLTDNMLIIARYTAAMFGQQDFPGTVKLPGLYLSIFGNLHLSKNEYDQVTLGEPELKYGQKLTDDSKVTPMWAFLSAQLDHLTTTTYPGDSLCDMIAGYSLICQSAEWNKSRPMPLIVIGMRNAQRTGITLGNTSSIVSQWYQTFLYGYVGNINIIRQSVFIYILNLMVKKMDETHLSHLFSSESPYRTLRHSSTIRGKEPQTSALLEYALEALDSDLEPTKSNKKSPSESKQTDSDTPPESEELDPEQDPSTEDGGYDPSVPPPAVPSTVPVMDKDTIDLISFDKTGEGVEEDLYRSAVVSLNDRIQSDDSVPVSAFVKDSLAYWVNGFLYRTAISATKDQIATLKLDQYLKNVSTKG